MISQDELGGIIGRLALADDAALKAILSAAQKAGAAMLPDDLEKLRRWAGFMRVLRMSIDKVAK